VVVEGEGFLTKFLQASAEGVHVRCCRFPKSLHDSAATAKTSPVWPPSTSTIRNRVPALIRHAIPLSGGTNVR
jgi:hypothetical protein